MKDIIFGFFLGLVFALWLALNSDAFVSISADGYLIRGGETFRLVPVNAPAHRESGDADSTESPDSAHWRCPHCECVVNPEDVTYGDGSPLGAHYESELWHDHGLLHPSEGGGFQRYEEGDENTKIPTPFDMLYDDGEITTHEGDPTRYAFSPNFAWRPHFEEGGAE